MDRASYGARLLSRSYCVQAHANHRQPERGIYHPQLHHHGYLNPLTIGAWWVTLTKRVPNVTIVATGGEI